MKLNPAIPIKYVRIIFAILGLQLVIPVVAQNKKERLRIGAVYTKIMDGPIYFDLSTSARIDRTNLDVPHIDLDIFYEVDGEEFPLGKVRTGPNGNARYTLESLYQIQADSTGLYNLGASFDGNDTFRRASRNLEFRDAAVHAGLEKIDSLHYISARLTDVGLDSLVEGALINVQVKRMFKPLKISEDLLMTNAEGSVLVPVPQDIPGQDGMLEIEIVTEENDTYGIVKTTLDAQLGIPIEHTSTYDQRALWARSRKAPIFILIFTGVLVIGSWGLILYLILNMYRIAKP